MNRPQLDYVLIERTPDSDHIIAHAGRLAAEADGWDTSQANIVKLDAGYIAQWFNANAARKRVQTASDWAGVQGWLSVYCFFPDPDQIQRLRLGARIVLDSLDAADQVDPDGR